MEKVSYLQIDGKANDVNELLVKFLKENNINFKSVRHKATFTSEESAKERGENLDKGGKAIVMKVDDCFKLFVLSAIFKINTKKIKAKFGCKKIRFATPDELKNLTGLVPGSVPPFGYPVLQLELYVDSSILKNEEIAFNAGSLTDSIVMNVNDYMKTSNGVVFDFSN